MKRRKYSAKFCFSCVFGFPRSLCFQAFVNVYSVVFDLFVIGRCLFQNSVVRLKRISFEMNTNESRMAQIEFLLDSQNQKQRINKKTNTQRINAFFLDLMPFPLNLFFYPNFFLYLELFL